MKTTPSTYLCEAQQIAGQITDWRRDFHRHPELRGSSPSPVMLLGAALFCAITTELLS